jgi:cell division protein FtsB
MKYYVVSIGAIFIALGIGIIVGFNLNYDQELSKQQAVVIDDLDRKFEQLKGTNDSLEESLEVLNENYETSIDFINKNAQKIITNALENRSIGIISTDEANKYNEKISETLKYANAKVAFDIIINDSILNEEKYAQISSDLETNIKNNEELIDFIVNLFETKWNEEKFTYLSNLGIISINSIDEEYFNYDSVVLIGESENDDKTKIYNQIDKVFISKLKKAQKYVVGVQFTDSTFSYIDLFSEDKISTIDNADEGIGQVSLITELKNKKSETKNYGKLETADTIISIEGE